MAHLRLCFATISAAMSVLLFIPGAPVHAFVQTAPFLSSACSFRPFLSSAFVQTAPFLSSARGIAPAAVRTHASAGIYGLKMLRENYDLIVIGAGPTGLTAALAAAAGGRTCLIVDGTEKGKVQFSGPTGLFSKALRDAAKKIDVRTLREMGLRDETVWKQVEALTSDIVKLCGQSNLEVVMASRIPHLRGTASIVDPETTRVTFLDSARTVDVKGKATIIATGSRPYRLPGIPYDDKRVFDSDTIRNLSFLPRSVTIVGAGIIAIEYAKIFSTLDCRVTMIVRSKSLEAALKRIGVDRDITLGLQRDLCTNKVRIIFDAQIEEVLEPPQGRAGGPRRPISIKVKQASSGKPLSEIRSDILMTATGRSANTDGLGLESLGITLNKDGSVPVDSGLATAIPGIYAAGDVLGAPALASTGIEQANDAVKRILDYQTEVYPGTWMRSSDKKDPASMLMSPLSYPVGIWTNPEVSFIGRTRERALADGWAEVEVGEAIAPYSSTIRGRVQGCNIGLLKLVFEKPTGRILGVHILGEDACELIHYGTALAQSGKTVFEVLGTVFTAVTFHELFKNAALDAVRQLEEDEWVPLLDRLDGSADQSNGSTNEALSSLLDVDTVIAGLESIGMGEGLQTEIRKALEQFGDQDENRAGTQLARGRVLQVLKKYRMPRQFARRVT